MTPARYHKVYRALRQRQHDLTVLYENLEKVHNLAAIARTGETVGVERVHAIAPEPVKLRGLAGRGAHRWVTVETHSTTAQACASLKKEGFTIVATHLGEDAIDFRDYDFTQPTAIMMGNEGEGLSEEAVQLADVNVIIPMMGVVGALNVSVAAAVLLFEAQRQRLAAGFYQRVMEDEATLRTRVFEECYPRISRHYREKGLPYPELDEDGQVV